MTILLIKAYEAPNLDHYGVILLKKFGKKKSPATYDEKYLLQELMMTKKAMYTAYSNLDNVTDPDLIDCYIYQLNSEQKRYNYLLAKAKESQLSTSGF